MENTLTPEMITQIYASTSLGVAIMLAAAGLGSALGWGLICMKYIEGIARPVSYTHLTLPTKA